MVLSVTARTAGIMLDAVVYAYRKHAHQMTTSKEFGQLEPLVRHITYERGRLLAAPEVPGSPPPESGSPLPEPGTARLEVILRRPSGPPSHEPPLVTSGPVVGAGLALLGRAGVLATTTRTSPRRSRASDPVDQLL